MKLELKHLTGYLPYELKVLSTNFHTTEMVISYDHDNFHVDEVLKGLAKPLLRPLSCLTKEININGGKFVPMEQLAEIMHPEKEFHFLEVSSARNLQSVRYKYHSGRNTVCDTINIYTEELNGGSKYCFNIVNTDWWIIQKLYEWHFDIHGLIEKGLAIDINTLDK